MYKYRHEITANIDGRNVHFYLYSNNGNTIATQDDLVNITYQQDFNVICFDPGEDYTFLRFTKGITHYTSKPASGEDYVGCDIFVYYGDQAIGIYSDKEIEIQEDIVTELPSKLYKHYIEYIHNDSSEVVYATTIFTGEAESYSFSAESMNKIYNDICLVGTNIYVNKDSDNSYEPTDYINNKNQNNVISFEFISGEQGCGIGMTYYEILLEDIPNNYIIPEQYNYRGLGYSSDMTEVFTFKDTVTEV